MLITRLLLGKKSRRSFRFRSLSCRQFAVDTPFAILDAVILAPSRSRSHSVSVPRMAMTARPLSLTLSLSLSQRADNVPPRLLT